MKIRRFLPRAVRIAAVLALAAAALEVTARILFSVDALFALVEGDNTASWRRRWMHAHAHGETTEDPFYAHDATKGWVVRPGLRVADAWDGRTLSTNSRGLRGSDEYSDASRAGRGRMLVVGDSFTFGEEVGDDDTYVHRLAGLLPELEVVNFGVPGYGHDQMLIHLVEEGLNYAPAIVLIAFIDYDIGRNLLGFRSYAKPWFELEGGRLALHGSPVPSPDVLRSQHPWFRLPEMADMLVHPLRSYLQSERLTRAILDEMVSRIRQVHALPVIVDLPAGSHLTETSWRQRFVASYCAERGLTCTSLRPYVQQRIKAGTPFPAGLRHWDAAGHAVIADGIAEFLRASRIAGK